MIFKDLNHFQAIIGHNQVNFIRKCSVHVERLKGTTNSPKGKKGPLSVVLDEGRVMCIVEWLSPYTNVFVTRMHEALLSDQV